MIKQFKVYTVFISFLCVSSGLSLHIKVIPPYMFLRLVSRLFRVRCNQDNVNCPRHLFKQWSA